MENGVTISHANNVYDTAANPNVILSKGEYESLIEWRERAMLFLDMIAESVDVSCKDKKMKVDDDIVLLALKVCFNGRYKDFVKQQKKKEA